MANLSYNRASHCLKPLAEVLGPFCGLENFGDMSNVPNMVSWGASNDARAAAA